VRAVEARIVDSTRHAAALAAGDLHVSGLDAGDVLIDFRLGKRTAAGSPSSKRICRKLGIGTTRSEPLARKKRSTH